METANNTPVKIVDLKPNMVFYFVTRSLTIAKRQYMCVHPNNQNYHIFIDGNQDPVRMHKDDIEKLLANNLRTYKEAELEAAKEADRSATFFRSEKTF